MSFNKETVGDLIISDRMVQLADKRISAEKRAEILARPSRAPLFGCPGRLQNNRIAFTPC